MSSYYRVCTSLKDKGTLIPEGSSFEEFTKGEAYVSAFKYNEKHKETFEKTGSVAGFSDVVTDILYFDLDNENLEQARKDTLEVVKRLKRNNINDFKICLSGGKGYHVSVYTKNEFTPKQARTLAINLAGDLESFDSSIYNANRIIRLEGSVHNKTGLRKTPIVEDELENLSLSELKDLAKEVYEFEKQPRIELSPEVLELSKPKVETKVDKSLVGNIDYLSNPYKLQPWKLAISQGFFPNGNRSNALMILGATLQQKGLLKEQCYYALKAAADLQSERYGKERFSKEELWENIIEQVYSTTWNGGTYAEENFPTALQNYFEDMDIPRIDEKDLVQEKYTPTKFSDIGAVFEDFVLNFEKNVIKTGIDPLDKDMPLTPGMNLGIIGSAGSGKCLAHGTEILMYDGSIKEVQDITKGERIMGDDSTPREILGTTTGKEMMYRIHTDNGSYTVNESHILSLKYSYGKNKGQVVNISVKDYLQKNETFKRMTMGYRTSIDFKEQELEIDPYVLGVYLGDGSRGKPIISNMDFEVVEELRKFAVNNSLKIRQIEKREGKCHTYSLTTERGKPNFFKTFINKFTSGKFVPQEYKINSRENRKKILAGLIDTDGHYDEKSDSYDLIFKEETLAKDIQFLFRSLGIKCTLTSCQESCQNDFTGTYFRLYVKGDLTTFPIKVDRKKQQLKDHQRNPEFYRIKVERLKVDNYYGFEIDKNKLFVLSDFTVTHNTSLALKILQYCSENNIHTILASIDMNSTRLYEKILYRVSGLSRGELYQKFKDGEADEIKAKVNELFKTVYVYDKSACTIEDIRKYHAAIEKRDGVNIKMVMVDYFERVNSDVSDDTASSKKIANEWQDYINDTNVVGVMYVQPNKMGISSGPNQPILNYTKIKGSSFLYQSFRGIISLWRPFYTPKTKELDKYMQMALLKNDLGELNTYDFGWNGKRGEIYELDDDQKKVLKAHLDEINDEEDDI